MAFISQNAPRVQSGFTLLEVIITLGIIGAVSSFIIPNIGLTSSSQMSLALRDLSGAMRSAYDDAIINGRINRLVIKPSTGEYWAEKAPLGYVGRPPRPDDDNGQDETARKALLEDLNRAVAEPRKAQKSSNAKEGETERTYSPRSILEVQRKVLSPVTWIPIDDPVLFRRKLGGSVAFASIFTDSMKEKLEFSGNDKKGPVAIIHFFPSGQCEQASLQLSTLKSDNAIDPEGPKLTVVLDALTGHSDVLEGFQDVEFVRQKK